jgi:hypothetical protein
MDGPHMATDTAFERLSDTCAKRAWGLAYSLTRNNADAVWIPLGQDTRVEQSRGDERRQNTRVYFFSPT